MISAPDARTTPSEAAPRSDRQTRYVIQLCYSKEKQKRNMERMEQIGEENLPEKNKIPSFTANRDRSASCSIMLLHSLTSQNILLFPFPSFVRSDLGSKPLKTVWMK